MNTVLEVLMLQLEDQQLAQPKDSDMETHLWFKGSTFVRFMSQILVVW